MFRLLSKLTPLKTSDDRKDDAPLAWARDPLQHPDLERMDGRELGPALPGLAVATHGGVHRQPPLGPAALKLHYDMLAG